MNVFGIDNNILSCVERSSRCSPGHLLLTLTLVLMLLDLGGCAGSRSSAGDADPATQPTPRVDAASDEQAVAPITNTDPCAMRLHDLCGGLLFYYAQTGRFPQTLDELTDLSAMLPLPEPVCPVSGIPYIYNPGGIHLPQRDAWMVLYDAAPSHSHMRWAVTAREPQNDNAPFTKVIAVPERFFLLRPGR